MRARRRRREQEGAGTRAKPGYIPQGIFEADEVPPAAPGVPDEPVRRGARAHRGGTHGIRAHGLGGRGRPAGHRRLLGPPESHRQGVRADQQVEPVEEPAQSPHVRHGLHSPRRPREVPHAVRPALRHHRASRAAGHDRTIRGGDAGQRPGPRGAASRAETTAFWKIGPRYSSSFEAYIPIQNGCDKYCTFCAVPYTRGAEVSRPSDEILAEVRSLLDRGYVSFTLLGQNVNSYGQRQAGGRTFVPRAPARGRDDV